MRISVKASLLAVIGVLLALLLAQGGTTLVKLQDMRADTVDISENWLASVKALGEIKYLVTRLRVQEGRHILNADATELKALDERIRKSVESLESAYSKYEPRISSAEERQIWSAYREAWKGYVGVREQFLASSRSNEKAEATRAFNLSVKSFDGVIKELERAIALSDKGASDAATEAKETYEGARWQVVGLGAISLLIGAAAGLFVVLGVSTPLRTLTTAMKSVAGGNLSTTIPSTDRANEIGDMARALVIFRDGLADTERMRRDQADREKAQAQRAAAERHQIADRFMATMGALAQNFAKSSSEVAHAARNLSATAEETSHQASAVAQAAEEASTNVQTVAASTEELSASVREINGRVEHSTRIAQTAAEEAASTEANIRGLSEAAEKIGDVVNLIRDIAGQTNLLALNATIEAARAGEAGRGFAVVATEVKALAAQTAKATDEIAEKIGEIQSATSETVQSISRIVGTIGSIREVTGSIASAVEQQGSATDEIAGNTHRAAEGAGQVTNNISGVGRAAEMTGAAATQLMGLSGALTSQADRLTQEVDDFVRTLRSA